MQEHIHTHGVYQMKIVDRSTSSNPRVEFWLRRSSPATPVRRIATWFDSNSTFGTYFQFANTTLWQHFTTRSMSQPHVTATMRAHFDGDQASPAILTVDLESGYGDKLVRVRHGGVWKLAIPFVRHGGSWKEVEPFVRTPNGWKRVTN